MFLECFSWYEQSVKDVEEWAEKKGKIEDLGSGTGIPCHKKKLNRLCKQYSAPSFPIWRTLFARSPSVTYIHTYILY